MPVAVVIVRTRSIDGPVGLRDFGPRDKRGPSRAADYGFVMVDKLMRKFLVPANKPVDLSQRPTDETLGWDKDSAKGELAKVIGQMAFHQHRLMAEASQSLLIILQGRDASGKDGLVRHVMTGMNPAGVHVVSFKVPAGARSSTTIYGGVTRLFRLAVRWACGTAATTRTFWCLG